VGSLPPATVLQSMNRPCRELLGGLSLSSPLKINPLFFLPLATPFKAVGGRPHCNRIEFSLNRFLFTNVYPNITGAPRSRSIATTITSGLFCLSFRSPPKPTIFAVLFHGSSSFNLPKIMKLLMRSSNRLHSYQVRIMKSFLWFRGSRPGQI